MKKGKRTGGKVATPIREMLRSDIYNGVTFRCQDAGHAEVTRIAALTLKMRDDLDIKTTRKGSDITVYKNGYEYDPYTFDVSLEKPKRTWRRKDS